MVKFSIATVLALGAASALAAPIVSRKATGFGKKGVAYTSAGFTPAYSNSASWCYNWDTKTNGQIPQGMEFVPNLHDASSGEALVAAGASAQHVLSFNEIDECQKDAGGVCMGPGEAAALHNQYMNQLPASVKVGTPSYTSNKATGWPALKAWKQQCGPSCRVDFHNIHYYGGGSGNAQLEANNLIQYIKDTVAEMQSEFGNIPVWLTEFAPYWDVAAVTPQQHLDFINAVVPMLDNLDIVERYSYFAATPGILNNGDNSLTAAGQAYAS